MEPNHYKSQFPKLVELAEQSALKKLSFLQSVLLASSGGLGILVSLHSNTSTDLYIRLIFLLSIVLLALGILASAITVYDYSMIDERLRQVFHAEVQKALLEQREVRMVTVSTRKRTIVCEKLTYIFLVSALLLLTIYSSLLSFYP